MGNGYYTGGALIWPRKFFNDSYQAPFGIRLGKVATRGDTVYNCFVEPPYSVFGKGNGLPKWQSYIILNMQFL